MKNINVFYSSRKNNKAINTQKIAIGVGLIILCIFIGRIQGYLGYSYKYNIVDKIDVETFKDAIAKSLFLPDITFNNGQNHFSVKDDVEELILNVIGFESDNVVSILTGEASLFSWFFDNNSDKIYSQSVPNEQEKPTEKLTDSSSISTNENDEIKNNTQTSLKYGNIQIMNESRLNIDVEELMKQKVIIPNINKNGPKVLIYHTHTSEAFLKNITYLNKKVEVRTNDNRYNVVRVGQNLAKNLENNYGIDVIQNVTANNKPSDIGAYNRSYNTAYNILKSYPSISFIIDLHRDGLGENQKLRTVTKINNKNVAKVMIVVGSNGTGLEHPNWKENLKIAIRIQEKLNNISMDLAKSIYLSENRYNQNLGNGALIFEIGGDGNTIDEANETTKYLAKAISEVIKEAK